MYCQENKGEKMEQQTVKGDGVGERKKGLECTRGQHGGGGEGVRKIRPGMEPRWESVKGKDRMGREIKDERERLKRRKREKDGGQAGEEGDKEQEKETEVCEGEKGRSNVER